MRTPATTTGFSLVELLVGIAIISGIATMAFYSLPAYRVWESSTLCFSVLKQFRNFHGDI